MATKTVSVRLQALTDAYQAQMAKATASTRAFGQEAIATSVRNQQAITKLGLASRSEEARLQAQIAQHQRLMSSFTQLGMAGLAFGGALSFGLKQAADAAIDFESSFAGVRKTVDGTEEELQFIADGIREMSTEIPVGVNELNRIAESAGQLGVQKDAILSFTETVAKMGVTTTLTSDDAANGLARLMNIMQTAPDRVGAVASTIVALGNAGASTEGEILDFGLRIAGAGKIAGLTEADILAIGNAMASVGVEAEAGGTSVQKVLLGITEAVATGNDDLETFASTAGMSAEQFAAAWRSDPGAAFTAFVRGLGAAGTDAFGILEQLGLTDQRLIRSFLSLSGAGDLLTRSLDGATAAAEENNALNEEAAKRFETTASKIQLAKNQINDAAISFGSIMLPAIAAVVGVIGDFAGWIDDLPEPLKVVAVVMTAAAAAVALFGGAALIALPRIAQTKAAMLDLAGTTRLSTGAMVLARKALNPWTLGVAAAGIALGVFISAHQAAKQRVEDLTDAIKADSGALGENTRQVIVNELQKARLFEVGKELGIGVETLTDAALGEADAQAAVAEALEEARGGQEGATVAGKAGVVVLTENESAARHLEMALDILGGALVESKGKAKDQADAMGESAGGTDEASSAADRYKGAIEELNPELEETGDLASALADAFEILAGTQIDAAESAIRWKDSIAELRDTFKEHAKHLDIDTKAGRENRKAILGSIDAALKDGEAIAAKTGSLDKGVRAVNAHIQALIDEAVAAGASEEEVREYIRTLNLTPKEIKTLLEARVREAQRAIDDFIRTNDGRVIGVRIETTGGGSIIATGGGHQTEHSGGMVGESGARRMHGGGEVQPFHWPAMRGNEVPVIAERGEWLQTAGQHRAALMATMRPAATVSNHSLVVNVNGPVFGIDDLTAKIRGAIRGDIDVVVRENDRANQAFAERLGRMDR